MSGVNSKPKGPMPVGLVTKDPMPVGIVVVAKALPPTNNSSGSGMAWLSSGMQGPPPPPKAPPSNRNKLELKPKSPPSPRLSSLSAWEKVESKDLANMEIDDCTASTCSRWSEWHQVVCACGTIDKWSKMHNTWNLEENEWIYVCWKCIAKEHNLDEKDAKLWIIEHSRNFKDRKDRSEKFLHNMANVQSTFPGLNKKGIRDLTRDMMQEVWSPMLDAISRKVQHMWLLNSEHEHHKDMMNKVKGSATPEEANQYIQELDRFFEEEEKLLAFSSHDTATQAKFQLASSYSDEWVSSRKCHFRMWYVCRGRTRWCEVDNKPIECLFVILSKSWDTLFEDPLAPGQRWKCTCGTRYRAGFGVICEVKVK